MGERVRITDVSPRDGLQNEPGIIPTAEKVRLVELLCRTGVDEVEVTSFVSPKWVPQLGDAAEVLAGVLQAHPIRDPTLGRQGWNYDDDRVVSLSALVPNLKGLEAALEVNRIAGFSLIDTVSVFTAASETFSKRNTNASIAETIERFRPVAKLAAEHQLRIRAYVSCVIACPFEGPIAPETVADVVDRLRELHTFIEVDLGDTIGAATPESVQKMLAALGDGEQSLQFDGSFPVTLHLHDTFGRAAECVKAALDWGVTSFDGSVAGLGGCPYASTAGKRAPGNIATETLVRTIHDAGYETGVNLDRLAEAAAFAREIVARSRAAAGGVP